jgi:hypothetical protein
MNKHFIQIYCYSCKNKANEEAQKYARQFDNVLVDSYTLENLIKNFKQEIVRINETYKRCNDLVLDIYQFELEYSLRIALSGNFNLTITRVEREDLSASEPLKMIQAMQSILLEFDKGKMRKDHLINVLKSMVKSIIKAEVTNG